MMFESIYNSAQKIQCPLCKSEFIPQFFHLEKLNFQLENHDNAKKFKLFSHSNGHFKPLHVIKKSWITSCPECSYVLRFVAEYGDKEVIRDNGVFFKRIGFKELNARFDYKTITNEIPFKEIIHYDKLNIEEIKNSIIQILEPINLYNWGQLFQRFNTDAEVDAFKFLVMFCARFEDYCKSINELTINQSFSYKVDSLNLSIQLKKMLLKINRLQEKAINDFYIVTESDFVFVKTVFLKLMFEIMVKNLKALKLETIFQSDILIEFQKRFYYFEIKRVLFNVIEGNFRLGTETNEFIKELLVALNIPIRFEENVKKSKLISKYTEFKDSLIKKTKSKFRSLKEDTIKLFSSSLTFN